MRKISFQKQTNKPNGPLNDIQPIVEGSKMKLIQNNSYCFMKEKKEWIGKRHNKDTNYDGYLKTLNTTFIIYIQVYELV